jgi:hypothetical protein
LIFNVVVAIYAHSNAKFLGRLPLPTLAKGRRKISERIEVATAILQRGQGEKQWSNSI